MTKKEKFLKAIREGKVKDETTASVFIMLEETKEEIDQKLQEFKSQELSLSKIFEQVKKLKGNDGLTPTDEELLALIEPLIPDIEKMVDDKMPTESDLLAIIQPIIPKVRDGSTPTKQELVGLISPLIPDFKTITEEIITKIEAKIPKTPEIDELIPKLPQLGEPIRDSLELLKDDERLDIKAVKGLDDYKEVSVLARYPKQGGGGSIARNFYQLFDVPQTYSGQTGKILSVKSTEDGLEFVANSGAAHDILSATHEDTTVAAVVRGDIIIGSGVTPKWTRLGIGASTTFLKGGTEPSWATLNQAAVAGLTTADSPTFTGVLLSGLTASELVITDASKNLISAAVATYPSLTELTYVKGVTSAIQTQFTGKAATDQTMYIGTTQVAINRASAALTLAGITLTTPDIGTPSAGVATNITGLVPANIVAGTLAAKINLGEGADTATIGLEMDASMSADERYSGITVPGTAGATLAFGDLCYLDVTAAEWLLADASAIATGGNVILGICVDASTDGNATSMLLIGTVRSAAFPASIALGAPVYISETAGDVTATAPTTTDSVMRRVGFAVTAEPNTIFFFPSNDYITHT